MKSKIFRLLPKSKTQSTWKNQNVTTKGENTYKIKMLQQRVKTLTKEINQTPSANLATPPPFPLANQSMFYN